MHKGKLGSIVILAMGMMLLTGCSNSAPLAFVIGQEKRQTMQVEEVAPLSQAAYDHFIHQRYILITSDDGELLYIPINNNVMRNTYNFDETLVSEENYTYYTVNGEKACRVGIDVSKFQGTIHWNEVKESGVDYAFVRLGFRGYGTGAMVMDETFQSNVIGARNAGLDVGVYFYSQATTYEEGVEEAQYVLNNIRAFNINYPIVYDTEDTQDESARTANLSVEARTDAAVGFCETIKQAGYEPAIYSNRRWFALSLDVERLKDYTWWYAQYANEPDFPYQYRFWQYSQSGTVPGISQPVDLNIEFE